MTETFLAGLGFGKRYEPGKRGEVLPEWRRTNGAARGQKREKTGPAFLICRIQWNMGRMVKRARKTER